MAHVRIVKPKKKRRVQIARDSPFPVPIETITSKEASADNWFYYTGELNGNHVVVKHSGDMDFLYKMGFFGKGTLSRSRPEFATKGRSVDVPSKSGEINQVKVLNRRSYVRHLNWSKRDTDHFEYDSSEDLFEGGDLYGEKYDSPRGDNIMSHEQTSLEDVGDNHDNVSSVNMEEEDCDSDEEIYLHNTEQNTQQKEDTWAETDEEFWGCGPTKLSENEWGMDIEKKREHIAGTVVKELNTEIVQVSQTTSLDRQKDASKTDGADNTCAVNESASSGEITDVTTHHNDKVTPSLRSDSSSDSVSENNTKHLFTGESSEIRQSSPEEHSVMSSKDHTMNSLESGPNQKQVNSEIEVNIPSEIENTQEQLDSEKSEVDQSGERGIKRCDSLCRSDEDDADVLVVDDSDSDLYSQNEGQRFWMPVLKKDPFSVTEELYLSLEEAFFLSFGLGCLIVKHKEKELDLCSMWREFCNTQPSFIPKYVTYHYFRSKGWVPKSGLKFGTDFILYKIGPPFYHGSYSVIVRAVDENTLRDDPSFPIRTFSWVSLAGLNRATEHVAKELMFCFVIKPSDLTAEDCLSPSCISKFKVKEMVVTRWVSSQERQKTTEDMP